MNKEKLSFKESLKVVRSLNKRNRDISDVYGHKWKHIVYNINCAVLVWFKDAATKERCLPYLNEIGLFRSSSNVSLMGWTGLNAKQIRRYLIEEVKLDARDFDIRGSYLLLRED